MDNILTKIAVLTCLLMQPLASAQANERKSYEMPRTHVVPIQEGDTDRQYELYIKLPEDYGGNSDTRYPVIFTTDAVVHMDMLSGATEFLMPNVILVGISYQKNHPDERVDASRLRDYSVEEFDNPETQARFQGGQASNHLSFIRSQVIPHIEENYRADPDERTYFGYSLGSAFGVYIVLSEPATFKNYILGSPSFGRNNARLDYFNSLEARTADSQSRTDINVFLSTGGLEESTMEATEDLTSILKRRRPSGLSLTGLEIIEDSNHRTAFPETVIRGAKWLSQPKSGIKKPYLGQKLPGLTPERFAPGLISTEHWEYGGAFSPDMKEFYFLKNGGTDKTSFAVFKYQDDQWRETVISPRAGQPFISPDGKTMHLGKRYKNRIEGGWSERKSLGGEFDDIPIMRLTASSNGTLVFDEFTREGDGVLRYSQLVDGKREAPQPFGKEINTGKFNNHPFIAPDESYIIWDSERDGGFGDSDIYISFRQQDGAWGSAINLGDKINTDAWEAAASVSPDGKYLFFNRNMGSEAYENVDIFWVDAQIIEDLRPQL